MKATAPIDESADGLPRISFVFEICAFGARKGVARIECRYRP